jgi:Fe2+ transport system protein FeoA
MHDRQCNRDGSAGHGGDQRAATCSLSELAVGGRGQVVAVTGDADVRRRLLEMGFCNGVAVEMIRRAPLGDPIEFRLRGYCLSLRHEQAKHVRVVPEGDVAG